MLNKPKLRFLYLTFLSLAAGHTLMGIGIREVNAKAAHNSTVSTKLTWRKNLANGIAEAKASKKYVLMDVYTDWCGWCHRLDDDTYSAAPVIKFLNKSFVCVKVNGDDKSQGAYVVGKYGVRGYPTIIVLNPDGSLCAKMSGYVAADAFPGVVTQMVQNKTVQ